MATTSPEAALNAVAAIEKTDVRFAILHNETALAAGAVSSDVDMVVDRAVGELVRAVAGGWAACGLYPIIVWPYDVGGTGSIFLTSSDAREGAQLDILHDAAGRGRYGARSDLLLGRVEAGRRFPIVSPAERAAYLLAKRLSKGKIDEALRLVDQAASTGIALEVLEPRVADVVAAFIRDGSMPRRWRRIPSPGHILTRLLHPVGGWVEIRTENGEALAEELIRRFGRFLPHARHIAAPHLATWTTSVAPIRWRAGVVASHGARIGMTPAPDVLIEGPASTDEACEMAVLSLASRYTEDGSHRSRP